jgi:hypothetical protein
MANKMRVFLPLINTIIAERLLLVFPPAIY